MPIVIRVNSEGLTAMAEGCIGHGVTAREAMIGLLRDLQREGLHRDVERRISEFVGLKDADETGILSRDGGRDDETTHDID